MLRAMILNCAVLLVALLVAPPLAGQRDARPSSTEAGVDVDTDGKLYYSTPASAVGNVQTGVAVPGEVVGLADDFPLTQDVLVVGRDATGGRVEHWKWSSTLTTFEFKSAYVFAPADFSSAAYDPVSDNVYLLDAKLKRIWKNSWDGVSPLPLTGWAVWASTSDVSVLANPDDLFMGLVPAQGASPVKIVLTDRYTRAYAAIGAVAVYSNGSAVVEEDYPGVASYAPEVLIDSSSVSEGSSSIAVRGTELESFDVLDLTTGTTLASGQIPFGQNATTVIASSAATIGSFYVAVPASQTANAEHAMTVMRRYGFGEVFADGSQIRSIPQPLSMPIGSTTEIYCPVIKQTKQVGDHLLVGNVAFAARDASTGADPVVAYGSNQLLNTSTFLPLFGLMPDSFDTNGSQGHGRTLVSIPNDTSLIGGVLLFQFWFVDGSAIRLSEIVGIEIEDPATAPIALSSAASFSRHSSQETSQRKVERKAAIERYFKEMRVGGDVIFSPATLYKVRMLRQ
ncbi:MAG: hypothetical protein H6832_09210 [Planctomycetes bacterium]|nr:hypothetical protein [Planctomycetota bacterium]